LPATPTVTPAVNKSQAAELLGVSRGALYSLMRRHGLTDAKR
jgi:hypothetical protein